MVKLSRHYRTTRELNTAHYNHLFNRAYSRFLRLRRWYIGWYCSLFLCVFARMAYPTPLYLAVIHAVIWVIVAQWLDAKRDRMLALSLRVLERKESEQAARNLGRQVSFAWEFADDG
jgi:hypothetical protein